MLNSNFSSKNFFFGFFLFLLIVSFSSSVLAQDSEISKSNLLFDREKIEQITETKIQRDATTEEIVLQLTNAVRDEKFVVRLGVPLYRGLTNVTTVVQYFKVTFFTVKGEEVKIITQAETREYQKTPKKNKKLDNKKFVNFPSFTGRFEKDGLLTLFYDQEGNATRVMLQIRFLIDENGVLFGFGTEKFEGASDIADKIYLVTTDTSAAEF